MDRYEKRFFELAKKVHGGKYDYSKVNYVDSTTEVTIICPKHGEFKQKPLYHLQGYGCKFCSHRSYKYTTEEFVKKANEKHNNFYDYSKVEYKNKDTKVCIICPKHGEFLQTPHNHLNGQSCPECAKEKNKHFDTKEMFIEKARQIHGNKYDYSKVEYIDCRTKVIITCPIHGDFEQVPYCHIQGNGCPHCSHPISKWEQEINNFIISLGFETEQSNRNLLGNKQEIDIFIPSLRIGIECDGLLWHNELYKETKYHLNKTNSALMKGIKLIHIFEDEWYYKQEIVKSILKNAFGVTERTIYARKCEIKEVNNDIKTLFLKENHIQGNCNSKINYGLYFNDELVSLMTFGNLRKNLGNSPKENCYELLRFVNKINTNVIGGASKLFRIFVEKYKPNEIISYCDIRLFNGNLYEKLGFDFGHQSQPNYFYVINDKRKNRFNFRKDILVKEGYDKNKTEHEIMLERGIYRIYDCGCKVYRYKQKMLLE